ncbi:VOC family protein [Kribbella sp. NPDC056345]|uniref:VOC family protein n=1 Tax=Kribbella sp. NPDC056345 TaxID=3345789 RepID=UPI0035DFFCF1
MSADDVFPIVTTADLDRLLAFYTDALGATEHYRFPPEGPPGYVGLHVGKASLGLGHDPDHQPAAGSIALWFYVDDCDAITTRIRQTGARILEEPTDQPWGERIARAQDPDGNTLILGQRPPSPEGQDV